MRRSALGELGCSDNGGDTVRVIKPGGATYHAPGGAAARV